MNITMNGLTIHYQTVGSGADILMLHGWGVDSKTFAPVVERLSKHFRVTAIDFPGFGGSDQPKQPWTVADYYRFTLQLMDELKLDKPIVIGHSFGGRVAIYLASQQPHRVRKMILTGCAGIKPKRKLKYYLKVYTFKTCKHLLRLPGLRKYSEDWLGKLRKQFGSSDYKSASPIMQQTMVKVVNEDLKHLMPDVKASTLLIFGEQDTATPVRDGETMSKLMPDAGLVVLKQAGHYAFLEKLQEFMVIVDHFLKKERENGV